MADVDNQLQCRSLWKNIVKWFLRSLTYDILLWEIAKEFDSGWINGLIEGGCKTGCGKIS